MTNKENPFSKIQEAGRDAATRKAEASEQPGNLNPQGRGGPVFDQMKEYMDTLGTTVEAEKLGELRRLFESKLKTKLEHIYNEYMQGKSGMPTHDDFEKQAEKAFRHGFELYLKVFLRLDQRNAPKPHATYRARLGGGVTERVVDANSIDDYLRQYITEGNEVMNNLPRPAEEHDFVPTESFAGYAEKYQPVIAGDREGSALAAYMFEKLRLYADDFLKMLEASLSRDVPPDVAVDAAHYVYGTDASMFEDELLDTMSPEEIAQNAILNRTKARYAFNAYKEYGKSLEEQLSDSQKHPWVHSKAMIRKLIFKYPSTADIGLGVVDQLFQEETFFKEYSDIPREIIVDLVVGHPDNYQEVVRNFQSKAYEEMTKFPVPPEIYPSYQGSDNLFKALGAEKEFMYRLWRAESRIDRDIEGILKEFTDVHASLEARAQNDGATVLLGSKRMLLREFLLKRGKRKTIETRAQKRLQRQINRGSELYELATEANPRYGQYFADLGHGNTNREKIENGQIITELILEEYSKKYGEDRAESYLQDLVELYYQYLDAGFEERGNLDQLKDALSMDPNNIKKFYEETLGGSWPAGIKEIPLNAQYLEDWPWCN